MDMKTKRSIAKEIIWFSGGCGVTWIIILIAVYITEHTSYYILWDPWLRWSDFLKILGLFYLLRAVFWAIKTLFFAKEA